MTENQAREALVDAGNRLVARGLVARTWGNLSVLLDPMTMLITPSGVPYADLTPARMVKVDLSTGTWQGSQRPSGERKVHREIYARRPDVQAVVHTHQNAASACSVARRSVPTSAGPIACARYALPGTKALTRNTVRALGQQPAVLLANHGVFAVGTSLEEAFDRVAALEKDCADHLALHAVEALPCRTDASWDPSWVTTEVLADGTPVLCSVAPFTLAWSKRGVPLPSLLDDLAQLVGPRARVVNAPPARRQLVDAVLVRGRGLWAWGSDAEALVLVVEKAARAALAGPGLGPVRGFPAWEATLMRWVFRHAYSRQAQTKA